MLFRSNDSINWFTVETFPETTLQDGTWAYYPINTTPQHIGYRLRETVAETFSLRQITFSYVQQVIPLARLNRDDYWNLPNKDFPSQRSLQYWYDRKIEPQMYLWPIPSNDFQMLQLIIEKQNDIARLESRAKEEQLRIEELTKAKLELNKQVGAIAIHKEQIKEIGRAHV